LTPTIRFHESFGNLVKKCHPRNVGGDTRRPGSQGRLNRGVLRETTPPRPYKSQAAAVKKFLRLSSFSRFVHLSLRGTWSSARKLASSRSSSCFSKVFLYLSFVNLLFVKLRCSDVAISRVLFSNVTLNCLYVRSCWLGGSR
jgi:hypothetical protein